MPCAFLSPSNYISLSQCLTSNVTFTIPSNTDLSDTHQFPLLPSTLQQMKRYQKLRESGSSSDLDTGRSNLNFEFPRAISPAVPNDVVFCGKVITRQSGPGPEPHRSEASAELNSGRTNGFTAMLRSPSGRESRCRRSDSSRKRYNGMFGTVKFPLQMELSDIKMRQERREPMPMPKFPLKEGGGSSGGGESCWELVRPLRRRGTLMSALAKASFGCLRIV